LALAVALAASIVAFSGAVQAQERPDGQGRPQTVERGASDTRGNASSQGTVEKLRSWADDQQGGYRQVIARLRRLGISPEFGSLGPGSGIGGGLTFRREIGSSFPIDLESSARFTYRGYQRYDLRIGLVAGGEHRTSLQPPDQYIGSQLESADVRRPGLGIYADIRYRHSPLNRFFGQGNESSAGSQTSYTLSGGSYELVAEYQANEWLGFAARGGLLDFDIGRGRDAAHPSTISLFGEDAAPGIARQPMFLHLAGGVAIEGRDSVEAPRSGGAVGLLVERFDSRSRDYDFTRVALDARYFVPATRRSVVALRALTSHDMADAGARVQFYLQHTLGGSETLRGFDRARFRDSSLVALSAEYRFDVHPAVELAAFGDFGQVASSFGHMSFDRFRTAVGAGVRFKTGGVVRFRVDWAVSREGHRLVLSAGPSF